MNIPMSNDIPSIEDLIAHGPAKPSAKPGSDESAEEKLGEKMADIGRLEKEQQTAGKAAALGLPYVDFSKALIDREALPLLSRPEIEALQAVVFLLAEGELRMATTEPTPAVTAKLDELSKGNNAHGALYLISEFSLQKALAEYDKIPKKSKIAVAVSITAEELDKFKADVDDLSKLPEKISKIPLTDVITIILAAGIKANVSDIHIEAEEPGIKLRFRMDGVLHDMAELDRKVWDQVIARLKLLSHLKINITDKPQDGRISIVLPDDKLDIRVSMLPTSWGESVVMRLLRSSSVGLQFEALGIRGKSFDDLKREVERPNGMILTTGPTGSGKTTTLYAILNKLNDQETKIITLEDPVEYKLTGVNQSQIDASRDYTFAKGLRSILRQDPDVVMIGEIRDLETADTAINAALTGHLVLSTLHTNDAAGAIPRFLSMGVKPFLLAPAINAVIGQRLVRKVCEKCKTKIELDGELLSRAQKVLESIPKNSGHNVDTAKGLVFYQGNKCEACHQTGFKGRIGIYEIFTLTPAIEKMILAGNVADNDVKIAAQSEGMITMVQDGILKALDGITSVDEVFRVTE
ncbi:MAG: GspE/PulE family protein [Candidatus Komeilibacteria bacterium]|nr:GspE/PulE family protein [Candidatus Komeilibacteria bacterium]